MILELNTYEQTLWQPLIDHLNENNVHFHILPSSNKIILSKELQTETITLFASMIQSVLNFDTPYQLASKKYKSITSFEVKGIEIGNASFNMIAGPCSIENENQIFNTASFLSKLGVKFIRGGAFKPRTSPYSFRGLGKTGLKLISEAAIQNDLRVVTEILDVQHLDDVYAHADVLQVGSRNMQNFSLLTELGKINKPILLKRGMNAKTKEWLLAAEYILSGGNEKVLLCERGIRSFDPETRNVMDIGIIPLIKELSHLPIIADPSHGTGSASRVLPLSLAAAVAGADGLIIEVHPDPAKALSDSQQALDFNSFETLLKHLYPILNLTDKKADSKADLLKLQSL